MTAIEIEQVAAELNKSRNKVAFTVKEAAASLGVSTPTLYKLMHMGSFPAYKIGGKVFVDVQGLREWSAGHAALREGL